MERRTQERLRELANGGWEDMDPLTRRCMVVLSEELDKLHESQRGLRKLITESLAQVHTELADTRKSVIVMMSAIIVTVVGTGIVNAVWR